MSSMINYVTSFFYTSEPAKQKPFADENVTLTDWTGKVYVITDNKDEYLAIEGHRIIFNPLTATKFDHTKLKNIEIKKDGEWFNIEFVNVNGKNNLMHVTLKNGKEKDGNKYCEAIG